MFQSTPTYQSCLKNSKTSSFRVEKKRVRFNGQDQVRTFQRHSGELTTPPRTPNVSKTGGGFENDDYIVKLHLEQAKIHKRLSRHKAIMDRDFLARLLTPGTELCQLLRQTLYQRRKKKNAYLYRQKNRPSQKRKGRVRGKCRVKKLHWEFAQRVKNRLHQGARSFLPSGDELEEASRREDHSISRRDHIVSQRSENAKRLPPPSGCLLSVNKRTKSAFRLVPPNPPCRAIIASCHSAIMASMSSLPPEMLGEIAACFQHALIGANKDWIADQNTLAILSRVSKSFQSAAQPLLHRKIYLAVRDPVGVSILSLIKVLHHREDLRSRVDHVHIHFERAFSCRLKRTMDDVRNLGHFARTIGRPNLSTALEEWFRFESVPAEAFNAFKKLKHLTLWEAPLVEDVSSNQQGILEIPPGLHSFDYCVRSSWFSDELNISPIKVRRALAQHSDTLIYIYVRFHLESGMEEDGWFDTFGMFKRLEYLSVDPADFARNDQNGSGPNAFIKTLPRSLRSLTFLDHHHSELQDIVWLADAVQKGDFENLESFTIHVTDEARDFVYTTLGEIWNGIDKPDFEEDEASFCVKIVSPSDTKELWCYW
ncbi:hypothetical protein CSAL01_01878 [Colletotrichum salicis]|uniref:Uncharacterized protein n=1 Tax=Colletotrichum salicis TaxID=1209931 RepID=A0A135V9F6_9PEZI|nr:hypothetical protein CSAL01_01878 [Colletotrichum salicis]